MTNAEILTLYQQITIPELEQFTEEMFNSQKDIGLNSLFYALKVVNRHEHLATLRDIVEEHCYHIVVSSQTDAEIRTKWFIQLARCVFSISPLDASEYYNKALDSVSKFGDELPDRWRASVNILERCAYNHKATPEIAYRFARCAEMVNDDGTYESFLNEAIVHCCRLDPNSAFAILSRWRDRDVGQFDDQLLALAHEAISQDIISGSVAWSLSQQFPQPEVEGRNFRE